MIKNNKTNEQINISQKRIEKIALSEKTKQIILGGMLGDGSLVIHKGYKNARYSFRHSITQKEWFYWKALNLAEITSTKSVFTQKADGWSKNPKLRFQSKAHPLLTELYYILCKPNKKKVRRLWLNHLTPLGLMVWWLDDGSIIGGGRKGVLCTDSFSSKEISLLQRYLLVVWRIKTTILIHTSFSKEKHYNRIYFSEPASFKKFLLLIMPFIPVSQMLYKTMISYKDPNLQQRWISEMKKALPHYSTEIDSLFLEKTKKKA